MRRRVTEPKAYKSVRDTPPSQRLRSGSFVAAGLAGLPMMYIPCEKGLPGTIEEGTKAQPRKISGVINPDFATTLVFGSASLPGTPMGKKGHRSTGSTVSGNSPQCSYEINLAILGQQGVGKSALAVKYMTRRYIVTYDPYSEDNYSKMDNIDGNNVVLRILDTYDSENTDPQRYLRWGDIFLVIFSITDRASFDQARVYLDMVYACRCDTSKHNVIALIGNKTDLTRYRKITQSEGAEVAAAYDCLYFETCAAEDYNNVENVFHTVARQYLTEETAGYTIAPPNASPPSGKNLEDLTQSSTSDDLVGSRGSSGVPSSLNTRSLSGSMQATDTLCPMSLEKYPLKANRSFEDTLAKEFDSSDSSSDGGISKVRISKIMAQSTGSINPKLYQDSSNGSPVQQPTTSSSSLTTSTTSTGLGGPNSLLLLENRKDTPRSLQSEGSPINFDRRHLGSLEKTKSPSNPQAFKSFLNKGLGRIFNN